MNFHILPIICRNFPKLKDINKQFTKLSFYRKIVISSLHVGLHHSLNCFYRFFSPLLTLINFLKAFLFGSVDQSRGTQNPPSQRTNKHTVTTIKVSLFWSFTFCKQLHSLLFNCIKLVWLLACWC